MLTPIHLAPFHRCALFPPIAVPYFIKPLLPLWEFRFVPLFTVTNTAAKEFHPLQKNLNGDGDRKHILNVTPVEKEK